MLGGNWKRWIQYFNTDSLPAPEVTRAERKTMDIAKVFGVVLDRNVEEGLELLLSGRFSELCKKRMEPSREMESRKMYQELEDLVMGHYPGAKEDREEFLNWFAEYEGEANEDFYLLGIRDGIRAAKCFAAV